MKTLPHTLSHTVTRSSLPDRRDFTHLCPSTKKQLLYVCVWGRMGGCVCYRQKPERKPQHLSSLLARYHTQSIYLATAVREDRKTERLNSALARPRSPVSSGSANPECINTEQRKTDYKMFLSRWKHFFSGWGVQGPQVPRVLHEKGRECGSVMEVTTIYDLIPIGMTGTVPNIFYSFSRLPMTP